MGYIVAKDMQTQMYMQGVADGVQDEIERDYEQQLILQTENFAELSNELIQFVKTRFPSDTLLSAGYVEAGTVDVGGV